ncbi:uncharacterized protein [Haliotis asinina]|uniref:uncharacterized protein n=1 Tax=Haliotis asinina TaxID=109174 RepID=UPI003531D736
MFASVFLALLSSLLVTSHTAAVLPSEIDVCKPTSRLSQSFNLVHHALDTTSYSSCTCRITAGSNVKMKTEPGNTCEECWNEPNDAKTCIIHCVKSKEESSVRTLFLQSGIDVSITMTDINGTIMSVKATDGNLKVQCNQTDPVTCTANKNDVNKGSRPECSSVSKPATYGRNTKQPQPHAAIDIDVCSSNTTRGPRVNLIRGRDEPQTCTCSVRSTACLTMHRLSTSTQCGACTSQTHDEGLTCTTRCEMTSECTWRMNITVNAYVGKGSMLSIYGHTGDNSAEGSAELEVRCNPRSTTNIDEGAPSKFPTTTVTVAVTSVTILIMLVAILVAVVYCKRRKRMKRNPVYMTLGAGSGQGTVQVTSPPRPEDASEQRLNGQEAPGSNPCKGHNSHSMASTSVHHPTEGGVKGQSHQGEDIRSRPIDVIPKEGTVGEGMYDSVGTPKPDPRIGRGGVCRKLNQDPGEESMYDHAHGGTTGKVQQVTGVYGRLGQRVDDDVYDHARGPDVTTSVADGSTYGRLKDVADDDVYNHTKTTASKREAYDNEDFSRLKQDEEVLGKC